MYFDQNGLKSNYFLEKLPNPPTTTPEGLINFIDNGCDQLKALKQLLQPPIATFLSKISLTEFLYSFCFQIEEGMLVHL